MNSYARLVCIRGIKQPLLVSRCNQATAHCCIIEKIQCDFATDCFSSGAKTIKKNTNSTQNNSQTHRANQYEVTSFLSTDCELSTETCSKDVYSLGPWLCYFNQPNTTSNNFY